MVSATSNVLSYTITSTSTWVYGGTTLIGYQIPYVTGGTNYWPQTHWTTRGQEPEWYPIKPINRQQRRLLESGHLPWDAIRLASEVLGKRGEKHKLAKWDQLFFLFWARKITRDRAPRHEAREHVRQEGCFTSPLRRFAGGKFIVR